MKRALALFIPATVMAVSLGAGMRAVSSGSLHPDIWHWLWPGLVALGFLLFSLTVIFLGAIRWLWPLATGFIVQTIGVLILLSRENLSAWAPLQWTMSAIGLVLLVMLIIWIVEAVRTQRLKQKITETDQEEIRGKMLEAMEKLEIAVGKRNAVYELPWFLIFGRSAVGKTTAVKNSGIGLPMRGDRLKGRGGNVTLEFLFTNEMIFLDTPGKWVMDGADEASLKNWSEIFRFLRKNRRRRPLDGLVVVVSADDLVATEPGELEVQAGNIREVMDLIHDELKFRIPVYLLITKSDLIEGFTKFFKGLEPQRRHEILGWSNVDTNRSVPRKVFPKAFRQIVKRLEAYRLEILAKIASRTTARELFFFTEEFQRLEEPLSVYVDVLFRKDRYHQPPVFRGFYFTSGTQGEGSPMGKAMAEMARTLGLPPVPPKPADEDEPKRSYFLLDLFRDLMVGDEALTGRTALHWWRRRRDTILVSFLPAALAVGFLLFGLNAFVRNRIMYGNVRREVPEIVDTLAKARRTGTIDVSSSLEQTHELMSYHESMVGFAPFRRFFMRRPGELETQMFGVFDEQLHRSVLEPTLRAADAFIRDEEKTCTEITDVFYSVIWLRRGDYREHENRLAGLTKLWDVGPGDSRARARLQFQFAYLLDNAPAARSTFLPGFDIADLARSVMRTCKVEGAGSVLHEYGTFQQACRNPVRPQEIRECYNRLNSILRLRHEDFEKLRKNVELIKTGLDEIRSEEDDAAIALDEFELEIPDIPEGCYTEFTENIVRPIQDYLAQDEDYLAECKAAYKAKPSSDTVTAILGRQDNARQAERDALIALLDGFAKRCNQSLAVSGFTLTPETPYVLSRSWRKAQCQGLPDRRHKPVIRTSAPPELVFFDATPKVEDRYSKATLDWRKDKWTDKLGLAEAATTPDQARYERNLLEGVISEYGSRYGKHWARYLAGLSLKENVASLPDWLDRLSRSDEFEEVFKPAVEAVLNASGEVIAGMNIEAQLRKLETFPDFAQTSLKEYRKHLKLLAAAVRECEENDGFCLELRRDTLSGNKGVIVEARGWVEEEAGPGMVGGALTDMLMQPIEAAERFVRSENRAMVRWEQVRRGAKNLRMTFPFGGQRGNAAKPVDVRSLLGRTEGSALTIRGIRGLQFTQEAQRWLDQMASLSNILLDDSEQPREIRIQLTNGSLRYEPPELAKTLTTNYPLGNVKVAFGGGSDVSGPVDSLGEQTPAAVMLFGPRKNIGGSILVTRQKRKGAWGRAFSKKRNELEKTDPVVVEQIKPHRDWAPIELLTLGMEEGQEPADRMDLHYSKEVQHNKKTGVLHLHFTVEGEGLGELIRLLDTGLPQPPVRPFVGGE